MESKKKDDRLLIIKNILIIVLVIISIKIVYMAVFKHDKYAQLAENKTYKELPIKASRGEIRDRYGELLAGNKNLFTVQVSADGLNKKNADNKPIGNDVASKLMNILKSNNEEYIDNFPIYIENGKYYYTFDDNIKKYKSRSEDEGKSQIPSDLDAKETFYYIVDEAVAEGKLSYEDKKLEPKKLQKRLNDAGVYPPISVGDNFFKFTDEKNKEDWLKSYNSNKMKINLDAYTDAKTAFKSIRKFYGIDLKLSDSEARDILIVRDLVKSQGFNQYKPVTIVQGIKESTNAQIEENAINLSGVSVETQPVRSYTSKNLASHILGTMGKMTTEDETKLINDDSNKVKKYSKGDMVGKTGIETYFEEKLKGTDGYRKVQVDAQGKVTKTLDVEPPKSGDSVYLTIDKKMQEIAEDSLARSIKLAQSGGTFKSQYGDLSDEGGNYNAKSGAVIAIDVKTGEVLSMASYPDYDPNLFATGISSEDYKNLQPKNVNDTLGANALMNLATRGAFQPGSSFKMIPAMAALDNGMSPNYTINDPGVIYLGSKQNPGRPFADMIWHLGRRNHGSVNLYKALEQSCNVYFYTISTNGDYYNGSKPQSNIGASDLLNYARKFGLDDKDTGLKNQIGESPGKVPSLEQKLNNAKLLLKRDLTSKMREAFKDITKKSNEDEYEKRIEKIVAWADEKSVLGRGEAIKRLTEMDVKEDKVEELADLIKFSHLEYSKWSAADTFNLSIGQGENQYTPAQMSRFVAAIGNGGNLVDLSVVGRTVSSDYTSVEATNVKSKKIDFKDPENLNEIIKGMKRVSTDGTAKSIFKNFPISVATKTGTAEKEGKIPTNDEYEYLTNRMSNFSVSSEEAIKLSEKMMDDKDKELTNERKAEVKSKLKENDLSESEKKSLEEELKNGIRKRVDRNDTKIKAAYLRKAIKELNPKIKDEDIDNGKGKYKSFSWAVGFAPADNPEIAIVSVIPQGEGSVYSLLPMREIIGYYLGLSNDGDKQNSNKPNNQNNTQDDEKNQNSSVAENKTINFQQQMKK